MSTCDPDFSQVLLLLHMNGSDGSTTFVDDSSYAHPVINNNGATQATADPKWGSAGGVFGDVANQYLKVDHAPEFDLSTTDFTAEAWLKYAYVDVTGPHSILFKSNFDTRYPLQWVIGSNGLFSTNGADALGNTIYNLTAVAPSWPDNQYFHVATTRQGNTFRLFINGVLMDSSTSSSALANQAFPWTFGGDQSVQTLKGKWDDLRISAFARYTANFTPPIEEFGGACPVVAAVTLYSRFVSSPVFKPVQFSNLDGARPNIWPVASPTFSRKQP